MQPIDQCAVKDLKKLKAVLCDIDDTLTLEGRLPSVAYRALEKLKAAGLIIIPVTGRPAGWCDHIARMWPVDGIVGENGAFYFRYDEAKKEMTRHYWRNDSERANDKIILNNIKKKILTEVPGAGISADQAYRETDLAIDFCEDVAPLDMSDVEKIVVLFEQAGAVAKISSIHVNGWFGEYDKLSMTRRMLKHIWSIDIEKTPEVVSFAGDSPNDAPMFGFFPHSVGVANVKEFIGKLPAEPKWVTKEPGGHGFAELSDLIIQSQK